MTERLSPNATIVEKVAINPTHWIIKVRPDVGSVDEFEPGQYTELGVPDPRLNETKIENQEAGLVRRLYSIASPNTSRDLLEFYIMAVAQGVLSAEVVRLPVDGRVYLGTKIKGSFTLADVAADRNLVMVATGTGIAPFMSMFRTYKDKNRWRSFTVIHGVRYAEDLGYREELEEATRTHPNFFYIPTVSRVKVSSAWTGKTGRIPELFEEGHIERIIQRSISPKDCDIFLCGNPQMIESMLAQFTAHGFSKHNKSSQGTLHFERYW